MSRPTTKLNMFDLSKEIFDQICVDICSVQPISNEVGKAIHTLIDSGETKESLRVKGYIPVSEHGIMWVKDNG